MEKDKMYKFIYSGNLGRTEIIVVGEKSMQNLVKELADKYNKKRVTVTFEIVELNK